jgi:hypothetical protein
VPGQDAPEHRGLGRGLVEGIPDNKTTRYMITMIKERLGFGVAKAAVKVSKAATKAKVVAAVTALPSTGRSPEASSTADEASNVPSPKPVPVVSSPTPAPQRLDQLRALTHPTVTAIVAFLDGKTTLAAVEAALTPLSELATREILDLLDAAERDVGDLRTVPVGDFEKLLLSKVAHTITDHAVAKLRSIIAAYSKPSTRRHVDIGVHVREMLTE